MTAKSINPTTLELLKEYPFINETELEAKISKAELAFKVWKNTPYTEKVEKFKKLYELMMSQKEELAKLNTLEMGMLYTDAIGDITKSSSNILFFCDNASKYLAPKEVAEHGVKAKIVYEPLGIIFSIMPWNYPFNQVLRSVVPNIIAGNVVLMKHASNVPQVAQKLEDLFREAGFPEGVYTNLFIPHDFTEKIIADFRIKGTNVTGSDIVGREVGRLSGKYIKPTIIELGGNDSFIVGNVSDIDATVAKAVKGRFSNNGQKCNCSKRFIVVEKIYDEFVKKFVTAVENLKIGDPMEASTQIGPLAKSSAVDGIHKQVTETIKEGGVLLTGGEKVEGTGCFYKPTVLEVKPGITTFEEETFGPVASIIKARDFEEAIILANDSKYGLGASVFSNDENELNYAILNIETGNIAINSVVTSYANLPYGGIKNSGFGKELGEKGVKAFVNEKVVIY